MFGPGVGHPLFDGRLHVGRELGDVERFTRADADLRKALHQHGFRRNREAELQHEVQDVEELRGRSLLRRRERLGDAFSAVAS